MLFGIVLVAVSLLRTKFGLVSRPMASVTFNWTAMSTIVLGMAFLTAEVARRARCAGHLSRLSSSRSHRSPLSIAAMARSCWLMGMLVLGPPFPRADTGCIVSFLQPQVVGQSVYGRVRQVDTVSMEVPVVDTPVAECERGRAVGEYHVLFRTQRHEPGVHGVDRVRCIRSLQPRTDAGHRHCARLRLGRVDHRGERVNYRRSRGRRRRK